MPTPGQRCLRGVAAFIAVLAGAAGCLELVPLTRGAPSDAGVAADASPVLDAGVVVDPDGGPGADAGLDAGATCARAEDCGGGLVCGDGGVCTLCTSSAHCPPGEGCSFGRCVPDLCLRDNGGCSPNAHCRPDAWGLAACTCLAGFIGDGVVCLDVDECRSPDSGCGLNATCTNTPGSRSCACNTGYSGDGGVCSEVQMRAACATMTSVYGVWQFAVTLGMASRRYDYVIDYRDMPSSYAPAADSGRGSNTTGSFVVVFPVSQTVPPHTVIQLSASLTVDGGTLRGDAPGDAGCSATLR